MKIALKVSAPLNWIKDRLAKDRHFPAVVEETGGSRYVVVERHFNFLENAQALREQLIRDFRHMGGEDEISIVKNDGTIVSLFDFAVEQSRLLHQTAIEVLLEK